MATKKGRTKRKSTRSKQAKTTNLPGRSARFILPRLVLVFGVMLLGYTAYLDLTIRKQFEGKKWALPAHVYTRPMELYVGQKFVRQTIADELIELGYQARTDIKRVGSYHFTNNGLAIYQRAFQYWDQWRAQQQVEISVQNNRITAIRVTPAGLDTHDAQIIRLEPRLFGSVSPLSHEDRSLLKIKEVPAHLINALVAIEDQQFFSHFGINPFGIARALIANIRAGRVVQGGSTLTQQLVKNYYLTADRTYRRKFNEMIMAVLLEMHYNKDEILQAYINEVFISQAGNRAIHGFALGSQHFFGRPLNELALSELALLAGLIKGPTAYNPLKNPQRAIKRRNLVLQTMHKEGFIDQSEMRLAQQDELKLGSNVRKVAPLAYPAFTGFLRKQLQNDYPQEDINKEGLKIYTTLNPRLQASLEQTVAEQLHKIESQRKLPAGELQVAAAIVRTDNGELVALLGDRKARFSGYNRALHARRPVGSLLKPFVYLTALQQPQRFNLASRLDDTSITVSQRGSPDWTPQNYDGEEHGSIMLIDALARSYNLATVQLGMQLGLDSVSNTIRQAGYQRHYTPLPSMLLGALSMNVLDVSQMYLSLASGGFRTPIKGVRSVLSHNNLPLTRYPLTIEQVIEPEISNLINYALQEVIRNGTGRGVLRGFTHDYGLAGKTGTTNDYRDSWFAGFSGNYLMAVWVGRDDNQPTGLTGASGAARVWSAQMQTMPLQRLKLPYNSQIVAQRVFYSENPEQQDCRLQRSLPILLNSFPLKNLPCAELMQQYEPQHRKPKQQRSFWERIFG